MDKVLKASVPDQDLKCESKTSPKNKFDDASFGQSTISRILSNKHLAGDPSTNIVGNPTTNDVNVVNSIGWDPGTGHALSQGSQIVRRKSTKPTLILVHGGWQGPEAFHLLKAHLTKHGYRVVTPGLPSTHTAIPLENWDLDVKAVQDSIVNESLEGRSIILVMHSYGAAVASEALRGFKLGTVKKLLYIAGWIPPVGGCLKLWIGDNEVAEGMSMKNEIVTCHDAAVRFYNHLPENEAREWASTVRTQSRRPLASPLTYAAYNDIQSAYMMCTMDTALPPKYQAKMAALAKSKITSIEAGHVAFAGEKTAKEIALWVHQLVGENFSKL